MKPLHGLVTAALLLTSCATEMTPAERQMEEKRKKRVDQVGEVTHHVGVHLGLSPLQQSILERQARQIAGSEDPLMAGLDELDKNPKLEKKAGDVLDEKKAEDVLSELGRENPELKAKADAWLSKNPRAAEQLDKFLRR